MDVIRHPAGGEEDVALSSEDAAHVREETRLQFTGNVRFAVLGAEDDVAEQGGLDCGMADLRSRTEWKRE